MKQLKIVNTVLFLLISILMTSCGHKGTKIYNKGDVLMEEGDSPKAISANSKNMTPEEYLEKGKYIWQNYVPKSGQAEFVQGELLRAIEKLRDEAQRNGNGNFNEECQGILIDYLRNKLTDTEVFDRATITKINKDLDRLMIRNQPYLEDDIFDYIADRIVDWNIFYGDGIKHENNLKLRC